MITTLVAESQLLSARRIAKGLDSEADLQVVGIIEGGDAALRRAAELHPDVAVVSDDLVTADGTLVLELIPRTLPATRVVVLADDALRAGTVARNDIAALVEAIRKSVVDP